MTDYLKNTGAGQMMIRDNGGTIEFWIRSGYSSTYVGSPGFGWSGVVNGVGVGGNIANYSGDGWRQVAVYSVGYTQDVRFSIAYSGTSGFGGPTDFWQNIYRAPTVTVPPAPSIVGYGLDQETHTTMRYRFSSTGDGGSAILEWQAAFGTNGSDIFGAGNAMYSSSGTSVFTGLKPGQYYAAWSRGRNAAGWGPWSAGDSSYTLAGARVRVSGVWVDATPYVKVAGVWVPAEPYVKVDGVWQLTRQ